MDASSTSRDGAATEQYLRFRLGNLNLRGAVVIDSVSDVVDLDASAIRPAPPLNGHSLANYILGMAESGDRMAMLRDIEGELRKDLPAFSAGGKNMAFTASPIHSEVSRGADAAVWKEF